MQLGSTPWMRRLFRYFKSAEGYVSPDGAAVVTPATRRKRARSVMQRRRRKAATPRKQPEAYRLIARSSRVGE